MNNWIGPIVKLEWNDAINHTAFFFGFVIKQLISWTVPSVISFYLLKSSIFIVYK